jgi:hypothetical protein
VKNRMREICTSGSPLLSADPCGKAIDRHFGGYRPMPVIVCPALNAEGGRSHN